jgi:rubrerythrin
VTKKTGQMTEKSLQEAFAGESMAHMRYLIFGEKAEKEGFPNVARLLKAVAYAERVHASNHARQLGIIKGTAENLEADIEAETYEAEEMYPAFLAIAKLQGQKGAEQSMHFALEAEKIHAELYRRAKSEVDAGKDLEIPEIRVCPVCGYTHEGTPPEKCPVCGAPGSKFKGF